MQQTKVPTATPSPHLGDQPHNEETSKTDNPTSVFIGMALDMSWRLAIVVLVPIIGGFQLDQHLDMTPLLTITGFLLAMGGTALIMWQTLQASNKVPLPAKKGRS